MTSPRKESFETEVTGITMYLPSIAPDSLTGYVQCETLARTLLGVPSIEEGKRVYLQWSTEEEVHSIGMMGIQVRVL